MEQQESSFEAFRFSEEEITAAREFTELQRAYLKTLQSDAAENMLTLKLDPYKPLLFIQENAYIRGQLDILTMLLEAGSIVRPKNAVVVPDTTA